MSATQLRLASHILKEHYGEIVDKVALNILRKGWTTITSIKKDTSLPISKVLYFCTSLTCYKLRYNYTIVHSSQFFLNFYKTEIYCVFQSPHMQFNVHINITFCIIMI